MWFKIAGSIFILFSCTYFGLYLAKQCQNRAKHIRQILSCIVSLKGYMTYGAVPLAEGLANCSKGVEGITADFFTDFSRRLQEDYTLTPKGAIIRTLSVYEKKLALNQEDKEVLILFASQLGIMDRIEQEKYLTMIEKRLDFLAGEAARNCDANCKMYRYLGLCSGLLIILILI